MKGRGGDVFRRFDWGRLVESRLVPFSVTTSAFEFQEFITAASASGSKGFIRIANEKRYS